MKSSKNFQKSKKTKPFGNSEETKVKKVVAPSKKEKNLKNAILSEIDELEEIDLFHYKDDDLIIDEESDDEE